jgi:hypothetical protein
MTSVHLLLRLAITSLLLVLGTAQAQSPVTTSVKKLALFGLVTIYNHSDEWMRIDLQIEDCENVAWITCGQILTGLDIGPRSEFTTGVFVDDSDKPYNFKPTVNWYEPTGSRHWRQQYVDLSPNRLVRKQIQIAEAKKRVSQTSASTNSKPKVNTAPPSVPQRPPTTAETPRSGAPNSSTSVPAAKSECGTAGEIRWIKEPSEIPQRCYANREQNWVTGNADSVDPGEVCMTATRPHSDGMPVPQERIKNMSACFCGRNFELSGSMIPLRCWNFYDLQ